MSYVHLDRVARFQFIGDCEFDQVSGEVCRVGTTVRLEPQPAALLALLVSRAGDLVTHDEIRHAIWGGDTHVNFQDSVHYCIRQIRVALGDNARDSRFIVTVPKRGYRLREDSLLAVGATADVVAPSTRRRTAVRWTAAACAVAVIAGTVAFVEQRPNNHHQIVVAVLKTMHDFVF